MLAEAACNLSSIPSVPSTVPLEEHTLGAAKLTQGLTFLFRGNFAGHRCSVLLETGASTCFVDGHWLMKAKSHNSAALNVQSLGQPVSIRVANDQQIVVSEECVGTLLLQRQGDSGQVVFPNSSKQRGVHLETTLKILPHMLQGIAVIIGCTGQIWSSV